MRESVPDYQLSYATPCRASTINNSSDSRDSFLIALNGGLLAKVGSTHRGNDIVQGVYEETQSEKHEKQDCVGHVLNQGGDGPADTGSNYNGKKGDRGAHSIHQIGSVAEDHATENRTEVDRSLNISYLLTRELERVVFTS